MPALRIHRRQEPTIEASSPPSPKPEPAVEDSEEPPAPKEPTTTRKSSSAEPTESGGGLAGLFDWGGDESSSSSSSSSTTTSRSRTSAPKPTPTIEDDDSNGFFGFGGSDEETSTSSRPTPRPTTSRTSSHSAGPTETSPGIIDGMDTVVKSCGGSQDSSIMSDDCKAAAQDNLFGAIILAVGGAILLGVLVLILKWFYVKFKSRRAPPRVPATATTERI
ncbi:hypothetical protein QFC20_003780 [Naganishia adeliensis]|uniref:Uncharacterized protein n=1 Tax=Naganishia adeliensis TaxID=92952 RepID=A0ACC2W672_9TREE|nr:hypothetical protein QFC20_003780 [Naganishia adeliensis]